MHDSLFQKCITFYLRLMCYSIDMWIACPVCLFILGEWFASLSESTKTKNCLVIGMFFVYLHDKSLMKDSSDFFNYLCNIINPSYKVILILTTYKIYELIFKYFIRMPCHAYAPYNNAIGMLLHLYFITELLHSCLGIQSKHWYCQF